MVQAFRSFLIGLFTVLSATAAQTGELPSAPVESALTGTDIAPLFSLIDTHRLADRAGLDSAAARAFQRAREQLAEQRFNSHRLYTREDALLLRLDLAPEGLNWLELSWHASAGETPLNDWYDHALGLRLSELVAGIAALLEDSSGRAFLEEVNERPERAWERLSSARRENPAAPRLFWIACGDGPCRLTAMEAIEALGDNSPALWRLDLAAARGDREAFDQILGDLRRRLGPDPALVWLGAADALDRDSCDAVVEEVHSAMTRWPDYQKLYPVMTQCLVKRGQYRQALQFFDVLREHFGVQVDWEALADHPVYGRLVESEAFRDWRAGQR